MDANCKGYLRIVNWRKLQTYSALKPPWIRFYTSVIWDQGPDSKWQAAERWQSLGAVGQALLLNIWAWCAVHGLDGVLWGDPEKIRQDLHFSEPVDLGPLLAARFVEWVVDAEKGEREEEERGEEREGEGGRGERERAESRAAETREQRTESREQSPVRAPLQRTAVDSSARASVADPPEKSQDRDQSTESQQQEREVESLDVPPAVVTNAAPPGGIRLSPPESDPGLKQAPPVRSSGNRVPHRSGDPQRLGECLPQVLREAADPVKWGWIYEVYRRLGFPYPVDSLLGRQQTGAFASLYEKLQGLGLTPEAKKEILADDLDWAKAKGRHGRNKKRGAVFTKVHKSRVATYLARAGPAR